MAFGVRSILPRKFHMTFIFQTNHSTEYQFLKNHTYWDYLIEVQFVLQSALWHEGQCTQRLIVMNYRIRKFFFVFNFSMRITQLVFVLSLAFKDIDKLFIYHTALLTLLLHLHIYCFLLCRWAKISRILY